MSWKHRLKSFVLGWASRFVTQDGLIPLEESGKDDVFIVGWPKSGNTWMQSLMSSMIWGIEPALLPFTLAHDLVVDVHARTFFKRYGERAFFKSHYLPVPRYRKVIYLVRDGRDAIVSYQRMHKVLGRNWTLEDMVRDDKGVFPAPWHEHVQAWQDNPYGAHLIRVRYEDLLEQPVHELQRICDFVGIKREADFLQQVVEGHAFGKMKAKAGQERDFGHPSWKGGHVTSFFRQGKSKDYAQHFSASLLDHFNQRAGRQLAAMGYEL